MTHIFISYSTKNRDYALKLENKLREEGFDIWIDKRGLLTSEDWWRSIVLAIRNCAAVVTILTPESDTSEWVQREITLALKYHKKIFPLWLDGSLDTPNWEIFVRTQIEDVRGQTFPPEPFYANLANYTPRKQRPGLDVTTTQTVSAITVDDAEVAAEIANPPPPTEMLRTQPNQAALPNRRLIGGIVGVVALIALVVVLSILSQGQNGGLQGTNTPETTADTATQAVIVPSVTPEPRQTDTPVPASNTSTPRSTPKDVPTITSTAFGGGLGQISFASNWNGNFEIYVIDIDGKNLRQLTKNTMENLSPSWSPDGQQIVFASNRDGNYEIYVMDADGSNVRPLTSDDRTDLVPSWSPDGQQIVFASNRDGNYEIYVMDADGSNVRRLTTDVGVDYVPTWSPDGQQIVFYTDRDGNYEIYVMDADGSNVRRLTTDVGVDYVPTWSPDGQQIVFASDRDGDYEIYVMDADGSNVRPLTSDDSADYVPIWSPDGRLIVFLSERDGGNRIYVMDTYGNDVHRLTNSNGEDRSPVWRPAVQGKDVLAAIPTINIVNGTVRDIGDLVNLRSGPGTRYSIFTTLAAGEELTIIARNDSSNGWYKVRVLSGPIGWVIATSVDVDGDVSTLPIESG